MFQLNKCDDFGANSKLIKCLYVKQDLCGGDWTGIFMEISTYSKKASYLLALSKLDIFIDCVCFFDHKRDF